MNVTEEVLARCESQCELCKSDANISLYEVPPSSNGSADQCVMLCESCRHQVGNPESMDPNHWRCLNDTMWSQVPAVQVMVWRILDRLRPEGWPQDLLDMLYLEDEVLAWAQQGQEQAVENSVQHRDSNGALLQAGDNVTLIKDLNVKGANFTAKRGTTVRNISLVADNPDQIEGKVSGQQIVILTQFVKKAS